MFVPPVAIAIRSHYLLEASVYIFTMFFSTVSISLIICIEHWVCAGINKQWWWALSWLQQAVAFWSRAKCKIISFLHITVDRVYTDCWKKKRIISIDQQFCRWKCHVEESREWPDWFELTDSNKVNHDDDNMPKLDGCGCATYNRGKPHHVPLPTARKRNLMLQKNLDNLKQVWSYGIINLMINMIGIWCEKG